MEQESVKMREILFRAKDSDTGEWIFGQHDAETMTIRINGYRYPHAVVPETVGQFTGLRDCQRSEKYPKGQMIFEGDIIRSHYANAKCADFTELVVFRSGRFCAMTQLGNGICLSLLADGAEHIPQDKAPYMDRCMVIGNIHDDPELMGAEVRSGEV